jgi:hypothetical protein
MDILFFNLTKKWETYNRKKGGESTAGLCYQGFVDGLTKLSQLIFSESTIEQSIKSMVYFCKYFLSRDGGGGTALKSCQFFDMELTVDLYPLTEKMTSMIESVEEGNGTLLNKLQTIDELYTDYYNIEYCLARAQKLNSNANYASLVPPKELKARHKKSFFPIFYDTTS